MKMKKMGQGVEDDYVGISSTNKSTVMQNKTSTFITHVEIGTQVENSGIRTSVSVDKVSLAPT